MRLTGCWCAAGERGRGGREGGVSFRLVLADHAIHHVVKDSVQASGEKVLLQVTRRTPSHRWYTPVFR